MTARLIARTGPAAGRDIDLDRTIAIGAARANDVRLRLPGISRTHARIVVDGATITIEDAGSTNGTFVNGHRVERQQLRHLDVVTLGRALDFIFLQRSGADAAPAPAPAAPPATTGSFTADESWKTRLEWTPDEWAELIGARQAKPPGKPMPPHAKASLPDVRGLRLTGERGAFELGHGTFLVGRAADAFVRVEHAEVSRQHAVIVVSATSAAVENRSANGTMVNGTPIHARHPIRTGDRIAVGPCEFFVEVLHR